MMAVGKKQLKVKFVDTAGQVINFSLLYFDA